MAQISSLLKKSHISNTVITGKFNYQNVYLIKGLKNAKKPDHYSHDYIILLWRR